MWGFFVPTFTPKHGWIWIDSSLKDTDRLSTLTHELGHALGLAHFDEGCGKYCKSNFDPEDMRINSKKTVMSYNNFLYPVDDMFVTEFDLKALRKVWGVEKGN